MLEPLPQSLVFERFDQIGNRATLHGFPDRVQLPSGRHHDHVDVGEILASPAQHFDPGDVRKVDVEEHQIGPVFGERSQRVGAGVHGGHHGEPRHSREVVGVDPGHHEVVVHHQHGVLG